MWKENDFTPHRIQNITVRNAEGQKIREDKDIESKEILIILLTNYNLELNTVATKPQVFKLLPQRTMPLLTGRFPTAEFLPIFWKHFVLTIVRNERPGKMDFGPHFQLLFPVQVNSISQYDGVYIHPILN